MGSNFTHSGDRSDSLSWARRLGGSALSESSDATLTSSEGAIRHNKASLSVDAAFAAEGFGSPPAGLAAMVADYVNRSTRDIPVSKLANMSPGSGNLGTAAAAGVNVVLGSLTPVQRDVMKAGGNPFNTADMQHFAAKLGIGGYVIASVKGESGLGGSNGIVANHSGMRRKDSSEEAFRMAIYSRDRKRNYRSGLRQLVASQPTPSTAPLPLTHVTDSIRLPAILEEGQLAPRRCPVFGDMRLYAFYARPAYRGKKRGPLHNLNYAPVCFIIDARATEHWSPTEVFPFDTGALKGGILAEDVHEDLSPFDFALEPKIDSAQRLARLFFGDERTYYAGTYRPLNSTTFSPLDAEVIAYESLVRRGANLRRDERGTSIELHFQNALSLKGKVLALILPQEFMDNAQIKKRIRSQKITPLPYMFIPDHAVAEFVGQFYNLADDYYSRMRRQHGWQW